MDELPEIYDDRRLPNQPRRRRGRWIVAFLLILALTIAAGWALLQRREPTKLTEPAPIAVVSDRPGGSRAEAEAIRSLRSHLLSTGIRSECIVISSQGLRNGRYHLTAIDRCAETRLGRYVVER